MIIIILNQSAGYFSQSINQSINLFNITATVKQSSKSPSEIYYSAVMSHHSSLHYISRQLQKEADDNLK